MSSHRYIRAVFPGTFDPITNGHLDLINRSAVLVEELIIAVGRNPEKHPLFSAEERVQMVEELVGSRPGIRVEAYEGLTGEYVQKVEADIIIRGIRDNVDLHYELQQANINLAIGEVDTVFLLTRDKFALTSSTYIKQIVELGYQDIDRLSQIVPQTVARRLRDRLVNKG
jgi:pantetheine-phosphate adenylyltransferase